MYISRELCVFISRGTFNRLLIWGLMPFFSSRKHLAVFPLVLLLFSSFHFLFFHSNKMYIGACQVIFYFSKFLSIFFFLCYFLGELSFPLVGELIKVSFQFTNSSFQSNVHLSSECQKIIPMAIFHFQDFQLIGFHIHRSLLWFCLSFTIASPFWMNDNLHHT